ncbi:hypothetical protein A3A74_07960 [Candidatus Roizmanbacteria bacterium RIFCSPLOWO2_01_FULL_35_13]|uniref:Kazal-like domain-containing protein n=1 Tax=Candidatus Roizmanbacteria bacterium RIFCSPLOWO2_01_FULL_35_13 TaxID=1802055 RepID=A0A1F7IF84_9BACT|nr:MAG: hypothetical protein A3A74_07960 [Candidatus Roizmanbacteria bacterium RIFCSPLOWO2_01_FULL_35_13]
MDNEKLPFPTNLKQPGLGVVFVLLLIGAVAGFQLGRWSNNYDRSSQVSPTIKACTEEGRICPDGSTVVRSGPNCEFAECPVFIPPPSPTATDSTKSDCVPAGCSGQLCVPASEFDTPSTCEMKNEYICLKYSRCERQIDGQCGWTQTTEYYQCLADFKK